MQPELAPVHLYHYIWLVPFCPFLAFLLISIVTIRSRALSGVISIGCILLSAVIASAILIYRILNHNYEPYIPEINWITMGNVDIRIGFLINNLSSMMMFMLCFVSFFIQIYSWGYMENEEETAFSRYFAFMSLFASSMLGLVLSPNFFQLFIFWELVGLCTYLLIGFWYKKKSASDAAKKAFVVTRCGDLALLAGIILLFLLTGTFSYAKIPGKLLELLRPDSPLLNLIPGHFHCNGDVINSIMVLIFCGVIGRSAQFPLHIWLPDATEAPVPAVALIHSITAAAAGVYMMAQTFDIFKMAPHAMLLIACIGGFTAFIAATMSVAQDDIKKILAYSTISQLGFMVLALGVGGMAAGKIYMDSTINQMAVEELRKTMGIHEYSGYFAGTFHLIPYVFFTALLFLSTGSVIHSLHTSSIWEMGKLMKTMKVAGWTFIIGALAAAGIPPLPGFWSKNEILETVFLFRCDYFWFFNLACYCVIFLTVLSLSRVYFVAFSPGSDKHYDNRLDELPVMKIPLVVLALSACIVGLAGRHLTSFWIEFINSGHPASQGFSVWPVILSLSLSLTAFGLAFSLYGKNAASGEEILKSYRLIYSSLVNKYWIDDFWNFLLRKVVYTTGALMAFIDEKIIDGLVNGSGWAVDEAGKLLSGEETGQVQHYVVIIILSLIVIIAGLYILGEFTIRHVVSTMRIFSN